MLETGDFLSSIFAQFKLQKSCSLFRRFGCFIFLWSHVQLRRSVRGLREYSYVSNRKQQLNFGGCCIWSLPIVYMSDVWGKTIIMDNNRRVTINNNIVRLVFVTQISGRIFLIVLSLVSMYIALLYQILSILIIKCLCCVIFPKYSWQKYVLFLLKTCYLI